MNKVGNGEVISYLLENIILALPSTWRYSYYRTTNHTEIDLVLEGPHKSCWAVEIKKTSAPSLSKGFFSAAEDIQATHKFVVYSGTERFPMPKKTEAIGIVEFLGLLRK
ncbi:MAG TPA: hypothetical protein VK084_01550 [Chitinophagaceae bacterium]|nr:hypothetical protein [Chitinophagaceae bacterium]